MDGVCLSRDRAAWKEEAQQPKAVAAGEGRRPPRDGTLYFSSNHISSRFGARLRELRRERSLTQVGWTGWSARPRRARRPRNGLFLRARSGFGFRSVCLQSDVC